MKQLIPIIITVALIAAMIIICMPKSPENNTATADVANIINSDSTANDKNDSRFKRISYDWATGNDIVYDKYTKVMYTQSYRTGMLTAIIDENGKPVLYKGE